MVIITLYRRKVTVVMVRGMRNAGYSSCFTGSITSRHISPRCRRISPWLHHFSSWSHRYVALVQRVSVHIAVHLVVDDWQSRLVMNVIQCFPPIHIYAATHGLASQCLHLVHSQTKEPPSTSTIPEILLIKAGSLTEAGPPMNTFICQRSSKTDRNTDYMQWIKTCTFKI